MSKKMETLCWDYPAETAAERLILLKIADQATDEGRSIYFSMETYARAGLLKTSDGARKIMRRLEEKGIIAEDPELEASLRKDGKYIRARIYKLNIENIKAAIESAAEPVIDAYRKKTSEHELSSYSGNDANTNPVRIENEPSSVSPDDANTNSVRIKHELSSPDSFLESSSKKTPIIPLAEIKADFEKLFEAWSPFEMTKGDYRQGEAKYVEIREGGISADQVAKAARVYNQQCHVTRCKTKHLENWLRSCVFRPEEKGLGEGSAGTAGDKPPAPAETASPRALWPQPWLDEVRRQLGDDVYAQWFSAVWLNLSDLYCGSAYVAEWIEKNCGSRLAAIMGREFRYLPTAPPRDAYTDSPHHPAGDLSRRTPAQKAETLRQIDDVMRGKHQASEQSVLFDNILQPQAADAVQPEGNDHGEEKITA